MKQRILALVLATAMALSLCQPAAAGTQQGSDSIFQAVIDTVTGYPGQTADVYIRLENNPGVASVKLTVAFPKGLTLTAVTYNEALGGLYMPPESLETANSKGCVTLNWFNGTQNFTGDGWYALLTFTVDGALGEYPITATFDPSDIFNIAEEDLPLEIVPGGIQAVCAHTALTEVPAVAADCENPGNNAYYICECGAILKADGVTETTVEAEIIPALGHSHTDTVTDPTCTEQGYITHICINCGDSYVDSYTEPTGHQHTTVINAKEPTCTEAGYTGDTYCEDCQTTVTTGTEIPATDHSYGAWYTVTEPTCTETGMERHDCACGYYETRELAAKGHSYSAVVTEPTCTEQGYTTHTCINCGDSYVDSYVEATGHDYRDGVCVNCSAAECLLGDINGDGEIDIFDANAAAAYANELRDLDDTQLLAGDVNGDGEVDIFDANLIAAYANELLAKFPAET